MASPDIESQIRSFWTRPISRRRVINLAAVGSIGVIGLVESVESGLIRPPKTSPDSSFEVESELGRRAEEMFNIKITQEPPALWSDTNLAIFSTVLSNFPKHTYAPKDGKQLEVNLTDNPFLGEISESDHYAAGYAFDPQNPSEIGILKIMPERLTVTNLPYAPEDVGHEIGHEQNIINGNAVEDALLYTIGQPFEEFAQDMYKKTEPYTKINTGNSQVDQDIVHFVGIFRLGLYSAHELPAILSEIYIKGKDGFSRISAWIDPKLVDQFYEIIKELVYKGREYDGDHKFTDGLKFDSLGKVIEAPVLGIYRG